jgi:hypothetical protein
MVPICLWGPLVCAAFFPRAPISNALSDSSAMTRAANVDHDYTAWLCQSLSNNRAKCSEPNEPASRHGPLFE